MAGAPRIEFGWFVPTYGDSRVVGDPGAMEPPSLDLFVRVARAAEDAGFDYALVPVATECWDAWISTAMVAARTRSLTMLCAARPGLIAPTVMAKMVATFDRLTEGRVAVNLIAGGGEAEMAADGLHATGGSAGSTGSTGSTGSAHDERYALMDETVALMKAAWAARAPFDWDGRFFTVRRGDVRPKPFQQPHPPFYIGGISDAAVEVGARHADVYLYWGNTVAQIAADIARVRARAAVEGREAQLRHGMRCQVLVRETEAEAWRDAHGLLARDAQRARAHRMGGRMGAQSEADARMRRLAVETAGDDWRMGPHLWAGLTTVRHGAGVMILGNPEQVAGTIQSYVELGCTTFCLSGYPHDEEARRFGDLVLPAFR
jgi:alkanesulfonate monooxygenase